MKLANQQLVLDTNILLHLLRGKKAAERLERDYKIGSRIPRAIISVVTKGELKALAYKFDWGEKQHDRLDAMLATLPAVDLSHREMWNAYAELDHSSTKAGIKMGKNDLWIAATARLAEGVLLTTDGDFDHLSSLDVKVERIAVEELR